jgi:prolyl-tRNA synthetase
MRQSLLFTKITKEAPKDETSLNAQLLIRAGFIDKLFAGVYTILPLGFRVLRKIEQIIREEMNNIDGQEIYMPALQPLENYVKTSRDKIDVLYYTKQRNGADLVLGQSHEEVVTPLMKKFISSYKDLPKMPYQFQTKFRNELRAKSGIMRGREFIMKDMYSFHTDENDLNEFYKLAQKAYFRIFDRCGLLDVTYLTYASGGTFSKYSHEFQTLTDAGEDTIHICAECNIAVNQEIISEQNACPACANKKLKSAKAVEVGNIFKLGTRFSKPFELVYADREGRKHDVVMGCYGIGLGRLMGTIVETSHDEKGIIWPDETAPFKVHLLEIAGKGGQTAAAAEKIYFDLEKRGLEVLYDDRDDISAGVKFAEADLIGCPSRLVVSEKSLKNNTAEIKRRGEKKEELVVLDKVAEALQN